jgi:hypothetical protein
MTRSWRVASLLAVAAAVGAAGCTTVNYYRTKAPDPGRNEGEWAAIRNSNTRRAILYDQFQQRAMATATYLSPVVREARTRRLGEWLGWTQKELDERLRAEAAEAAKYDDFQLAVFTSQRKSNDLDAKSSIWRLALQLDTGDEVVTRDATALDANATVTGLFPYVGGFDTVYRIRFNRVPGGPLAERPFALVIASALGRMELHYGDGSVGPDRPEGSLTP